MAAIQSTVDYLQAHASGQDPPYLRQARAALVRQTEYMSRLLDVLVRDVEGRSPAAAEREPDAILGLVRRVVELYGGHVTLHEGRPDRGTELRAWLPAAPPEDQRPTTIAPLSTTVSGLRILVVDDNEDAAEMLALVLRTRGFEVALAVDGEQALALARAHPPHVVLLDIGLPGIDGYEVARRLRAMPSSVRPVLVAVTGYGQPADRERSREAGFDHHLVKPMAIETLLPLLVPAGAR
jgi:CheY-like chemotaxis protein